MGSEVNPTDESASMVSGNHAENLRMIFAHDLKFWKAVADTILICGLGVAGVAAVIVGVSTWLSMRWGDEISGFNERTLAAYKLTVEGKVADAKTAGIAAGEKAGVAQAAADDAHVKLKQAEAQIADANARAAEANLKTEAERVERLKLEAQIAPRRISEADCRIIAAALAPLAGRKIAVASYAQDTEGTVLATQILFCLHAANIQVIDDRLSVSALGGLNFGVLVSGDDGSMTWLIKESLERDGHVNVAPLGTPLINDGFSLAHPGGLVPEVSIFVGAKPIQ